MNFVESCTFTVFVRCHGGRLVCKNLSHKSPNFPIGKALRTQSDWVASSPQHHSVMMIMITVTSLWRHDRTFVAAGHPLDMPRVADLSSNHVREYSHLTTTLSQQSSVCTDSTHTHSETSSIEIIESCRCYVMSNCHLCSFRTFSDIFVHSCN